MNRSHPPSKTSTPAALPAPALLEKHVKRCLQSKLWNKPNSFWCTNCLPNVHHFCREQQSKINKAKVDPASDSLRRPINIRSPLVSDMRGWVGLGGWTELQIRHRQTFWYWTEIIDASVTACYRGRKTSVSTVMFSRHLCWDVCMKYKT